MRAFELVVLWLSGLGLLGFGLAFVIAPLPAMATAGLVLEGAVAATELRAFYGGLELALGGLVIACALRPERRRDGLVLTLAIFAGIGLVRFASMLATGASTSFLWLAGATEVGLALGAAVCLMTRAPGEKIAAEAAPATRP